VTGAPNYRLPRQKRDRASFVRALRAERMQLITRLQDQHSLPAYRNNDELVLLEFGSFIARQMRWSGRPGLWQRFKVTDDRISNTDQPAEEARAQKKVEEMAARRYRSRLGSFIHRRFFYALFPPGASICSWRNVLRPAFAMTNIYECLRRLCDYREQRARRDPDREQDHHRQTPREHWSFDFRQRLRRPIC